MKNKVNWILIGVLSLFLMGCVSTITETRTVGPDGTYTVESTEVTTPYGAVVGNPWIGVGSPWVYYSDNWYYNGVPYFYFGPWGWGPRGCYSGPIIRNNYWYGPRWQGYKPPHGWRPKPSPVVYGPRGGGAYRGSGPINRGSVNRGGGPVMRSGGGHTSRPVMRGGSVNRGSRPANRGGSRPARSSGSRSHK